MNASLVGAAVVVIWCLVVTIVSAWAALRLAIAMRTARTTRSTEPALRFAVVRPCAGHEAHLERALRSLAHAQGPRPAELVLAVEKEADPAYAVADETARWFRSLGQPARVLVTHARGPNHKADQLRAAFDSLDVEIPVAIVIDSDVNLTDFDLSAMLVPFSHDDVAAVWAPPVETSGATAADRASRAVLTASLHAFALLARIDAGGMVGKVMALRRAPLERIGGFGSLLHHLGEDMELARRLRAIGTRVIATTEVAHSLATRPRLTNTIDRYARWLTVIRRQRPALLASYPLLFAPSAPLLVAAALLAPWQPSVAVAVAVSTITTRLAVVFLARFASRQPLSPATAIADAARADAVLLRAWVCALTRDTVHWRGGELSFDRDGQLVARGIQRR